MRGRLDAVIVDYLQIIKPEFGKRNQNRADEIGDISWGLKQLARELEIPVISLAQLNRQMANRSDSVPKLSDLRDSGRIEQDGDTIILLHKDQEPDTKRPLDEMVAIVAKQRNGPLGSIPLLHHKEIFDITDALGGGDGGEF
jgi:replicative DNA helicase